MQVDYNNLLAINIVLPSANSFISMGTAPLTLTFLAAPQDIGIYTINV